MTPADQATSMSGNHASSGSEHDGQCELLGPFALLVQAALGALALLSLVYKRWRERPQRPVKIWAFDVSKQVFGSALLHMANLVMSIFSAGKASLTTRTQTNPCSFYLLNLGIDVCYISHSPFALLRRILTNNFCLKTTIGIPILILILRVANHIAQLTPLANPPESIESGNYGDPPSGVWWLKQSFIYFIGLLGMKTCVFFIIELLPFIVHVGDWALKWTEGNTAMQIFFVMLLFPVIMNAIQYYIIDIFIKKPISETEVEGSVARDLAASAAYDREDQHALLDDLETDNDSDDSDETVEVGGRDRDGQATKHSINPVKTSAEGEEEHK